MIRGVLCDLSGVLYVGEQLVPGSRDALISLRAAALPVRFVTNVTRIPRSQILRKLARLGLDVDEEDLFTPATAAREYLYHRGLSAHLLVHPEMLEELADLAGPAPAAVLLGDVGPALDYQLLNAAFRILHAGGELVAMGMNRYFRDVDGFSLDIGPFARALEFASGRGATVVGKPAASFFAAAVASLGLLNDQVVMVGDDYEADVNGALSAGLQAILVRTGKYQAGDEVLIECAGAQVCDDLSAAADLIL
jgi:HAD superfamily hydrolase (TIGR01458 family)